MGLFGRFRGRRSAAGSTSDDLKYLRAWVAARSGVEGFVEPKTTVTDLTVVLVAAMGSGPGGGPEPGATRCDSPTGCRSRVRRGARLPATHAGLRRPPAHRTPTRALRDELDR
jgi:hypothetical protein